MELPIPILLKSFRQQDATSELTEAAKALADRRPVTTPDLKRAAGALSSGQSDIAELLLTRFLKRQPNDPDALHLMAQAAVAKFQFDFAESLLLRCLKYAPDFTLARYNYVKTLLKKGSGEEALRELEPLLNSEPDSFLFGDLRAVILSRLGRHTETAECYRHLTGIHPKIVFLWMRYAYALKTVGRTGECIVAYRKGIELSPSLGEAFWGLSDLKTFRFSDADVSEMETQLKRRDLSADNRTYFHFALGKAYHDTTDYQSAFQQFARANALRRIGMEYSPELTTERVSVYKKFFSTQLFAKRVGWGHDSSAPIFVVGMHRAGSTLIEQILCSHSSIDGIGEAQEVALIATSLESEVAPQHRVPYPEVIGQLDGDGLRQLGEKYLKAARELHHGTLPFFVDKNPVNFWNTGLIHLILPNAKIVDVRRHPMACCFSNFTSGFESELRHTYKQSDLGRYYVAYADLMAHFDRVLPGRIHRVNYERLVADTETELGRLFEYLGIPFERRCLEFHQTARAILTPSSEQVRRPINQEGINRWRHYEAWLGPLKAALEPVLASYPECAKG